LEVSEVVEVLPVIFTEIGIERGSGFSAVLDKVNHRFNPQTFWSISAINLELDTLVPEGYLRANFMGLIGPDPIQNNMSLRLSAHRCSRDYVDVTGSG